MVSDVFAGWGLSIRARVLSNGGGGRVMGLNASLADYTFFLAASQHSVPVQIGKSSSLAESVSCWSAGDERHSRCAT